MEEQHYTFHTLPAVFMLEAQLSESMVGTLNDYLDRLMVDQERKSHAGTLVGQIGHGQQLTMDHHCEELKDFNMLCHILTITRFFDNARPSQIKQARDIVDTNYVA